MTTTKTTTRTTAAGRVLSGLVLATALVSSPEGLPAQQRAETSTSESCEGGRVRGSLGITGLSCRDCSFQSHNGSMTSARFGTEPLITAAEDGSLVRPGDVLVALDGQLITTRAGAEAYIRIQPGDRVRVTLRRDGVEREIGVTAGARCDRLPTSLVAPSPPSSPTSPSAPRAPQPGTPPEAPVVAWGPERALPALPAPPAPPALSAVRPAARLGFAFECDRCRYEGQSERWSFDDYPVVFAVEGEGPASGRLRTGDVLLALEGHDLRGAEGGRAFSELTPGRTVRWTVERDGARMTVETRTEEKTVMPRPTGDPSEPVVWEVPRAAAREPLPPLARAPRPDAEPDALRYAGSVGAARVEVRGDPVTVSRAGDVLIIRTAGNTIRVDLSSGGG